MASTGERTHPATAKLSYATTIGGSYTDVGGLKAVTPANLTRGDSKSTDLGTANKTHEYSPGWVEPGEIPLDVFFDKTQMTFLVTAFNAGTLYYWKVTFGTPVGVTEATPSTVTLQGYIKTLAFAQLSVDSEDKVHMPLVIKATGGITWTAGAP
jgi:hypothetical protein